MPAPIAQPALVAEFQARLPAMLDELGDLVRCESPSSDLAALERSAAKVAALGERLTGRAPEVIADAGPTHLRWRFGDGPRRVLLVGHHDTVWPLGTLDDHPWSVADDGVVRGPGCLDMKAGLVQLFHALNVLEDIDGVTVVVNADEEVGSPTSSALIEQEARQAPAALVLEMAADDGALKTARKGICLFEMQIDGRAAHAGLEPERGINASVEAAHLILAITGLGDPELGTTVTPTLLRSGTAANVVPARATLAVDARVTSVAEQQRVDAALRGLTAVLPGATVTAVPGPTCLPMEPSASAGLFATAQRLAGLLGLEPLRGVAVGGASDGNRTAGVGTPTLDGLGAVGGGPHADREHVRAEVIPERTALLTALIADLLT
jgi:glutamate carboxypeptidase